MLNTQDTAKYKKILEEEKSLLETELSELGSRRPENPSDWVVSKPSGEEFGADQNENADIVEDMQDNNAALNELEGRLNQVIKALTHIAEGTYGTCEVCNESVEKDRLEANPAATSCKKHMNG